MFCTTHEAGACFDGCPNAYDSVQVDEYEGPFGGTKVTLRAGDLTVTHFGAHRGGCLYAGTIEMWNRTTWNAVDVTSRPSDADYHLRYMLSLARKHLAA